MFRRLLFLTAALAVTMLVGSSASAGLFRRGGGGNMDGGKNGAACSNAPLKAASAANVNQAPAAVPFKKTAPAKEETSIQPGTFNRPLDSRAALAWTAAPSNRAPERIAVSRHVPASPNSLASR